LSVYQWSGSSNADLANEGNWVNTSNPGTVGTPGTNDVAIIQVGQGLYGIIDVDALDIVQASGAPTISITGSSTQVTAASVGIGYGFTLDTGAYLQAGNLGIDGDGTKVIVQNNAYLYDLSSAENDVLTIGAGAGDASVLVTKGGNFAYSSDQATGTLSLGGTLNSVATLTVSAGGYFSSDLSAFNVGGASGASGYLTVTGPGSQFLMDNYGYTTIGDFGERGGSAQGTVSVSNGGYVSLSSYGETDIGTSAGMAKVLVTGTNSAIEAGPYVEVGEYQSNIAGEILVQSGGEFDTATDLYLNNGTLAVTGANSLYTGRILSVDNGAMVQANTGGYIHVTDVELAGELKLTAGSLDARAGFYLYGGSEITGYGTITATTLGNAGHIVASGGTLVVNGSITGTGTMQITSGAAMELGGSAVATQNILFGANANKLLLEKPSSVAAHILDFAAGDSIDLLSTAATKLTYTTGLLTVSNGTTLVAKLGVKGTYAAANFKLATDGHGGSLISYVATSKAEPRPIGEPAGFMSHPHLAF
jgi:T5SS/PEP-CTERM-associated repeat protein